MRLGLVAVLGVALWAASAAQGAPVDPVKVFLAQADRLAAPDLGPGWRGSSADYVLRNSRVTLIRGRRSLDGCTFDVTTKATTASPSQEARQRAFNAGACMSLMEIGRLPAAQERAVINSSTGTVVDSEAPEDLSVVTESPTSVPIIPGAGASVDHDECASTKCITPCMPPECEQRASSYASGFHRYWVNDPIDIIVTDVRSYITFAWDPLGGRVGCVKSHSASASEDWYSFSGWNRSTSNTKGGRDCTNAWASTYARYKNSEFCDFTNPTYVITDRNVVRGYPGGRGVIKGNTRWTIKGGCSQALDPNQQTIKTG